MSTRNYPSEKWRTIAADAEQVRDELIRLMVKRQLWRDHNQALKGDGVEGPTALVHHWIHDNYLDSIVIGLRRAIDSSKGVVSLRKVLDEIAKNCSEFTLERFKKLYGNPHEQLAELDFKAYSCNGITIDQALVRRDIKKLREDHRRLIDLANHRVAHFQPSMPEQASATPVTFRDLDHALDGVVEVMNKYLVLLTGCHSCNETVIEFRYEHVFDAMVLASKEGKKSIGPSPSAGPSPSNTRHAPDGSRSDE